MDVIRQAAAIARSLANTARLHHEPEEGARFEQIAARGEARAAYREAHLHDRVQDAQEVARRRSADLIAGHPWRLRRRP
jgi:hypothetical protein